MNPPSQALLAQAHEAPIECEEFPADQVVAGAPRAGWLPLTTIDGLEVGLWEMTPGVVIDTEADEVFCILSGSGTVEFLDPPALALPLRAGTLVRLQAGWHTRWTITQTIRKIAVTPGEDPKK
ncbi:cupin domain-containing protein [Propionicimonas sp.]|uniref:cupin domain-containing protein n=1 Tax=Propionicimonas sp. TaxID=1955623 RepID=UPI0017D06E68|nr:cupin domain-containing protein [Propionicimonas sp.]MBU3976640.1 DUF861 domain-containing protein [Actinomycetota bacterium]MBA3020360.1 cupin domain-containing protein [Propionicimonas sp.]MBU3986533.1 DUF861 domain-containing protein [Actinomycetota bacterium]MBU4007315.1 DUF861 domain-containing protein [Actinomycetota bacterium]MBU4065068.1 DUF861 domain-containing protein [Actinomycetota bacterium]